MTFLYLVGFSNQRIPRIKGDENDIYSIIEILTWESENTPYKRGRELF